MSKGFILVKSYPFTFGYVMFYLPTLDPMDNVTGRAAPPACWPWAGVPGDSDHDELGGVQPRSPGGVAVEDSERHLLLPPLAPAVQAPHLGEGPLPDKRHRPGLFTASDLLSVLVLVKRQV